MDPESSSIVVPLPGNSLRVLVLASFSFPFLTFLGNFLDTCFAIPRSERFFVPYVFPIAPHSMLYQSTMYVISDHYCVMPSKLKCLGVQQ